MRTSDRNPFRVPFRGQPRTQAIRVSRDAETSSVIGRCPVRVRVGLTAKRSFGSLVMGLIAVGLASAEPPSPQDYLAFIRAQAAALRSKDRPPTSREEWQAHNQRIRAGLLQAWGGFPKEPAPLNPRKLGELQRDGYRVEKIAFQTFPDVWMLANAYVPDKPGKHAAILQVHGHWRGAKQDPTVQARCIGAAKLGFFVLVVDAFGAGERGIGKALGEYHGEMVAGTLLPVGLPLSGLQVYENMRAVDYLRTRPEVDGERIGITGASGGGNQTMYAGSWDERFKAAVPVCSVGNYQAYLGTACCMCEVVPGALRFTEEWGVLGLTAPRGLMIVNATRDGIQFSVGEAKKSLALLEPLFGVLGKPANVRHAIFESPHDYNKAMREAMYGWMALHLKGEGDGSPIPEPTIKTENPEDLRCYPGTSRPDDYTTIPRFAAREGRKLLASRKLPATGPEWTREAEANRKTLIERVLGGLPGGGPNRSSKSSDGHELTFTSEPGIELIATTKGQPKAAAMVLLLDLDGAAQAAMSPLAKAFEQEGVSVFTCDLRSTGKLAWPKERVGRGPDHNTAQWGLWLGRPLLGQWTVDVRGFLDAYEKNFGKLPSRTMVVGQGPAGLVALSAAAVDSRITHAAAVGSLGSFVTDAPYENQRFGILAPGILRDVGDVAHLAALAAPSRVVIAGGVSGSGKSLTREELASAYRPATHVWDLLKAGNELKVLETTDAASVVGALR